MQSIIRIKLKDYILVSFIYYREKRFLLLKKEPLFVDFIKIPITIDNLSIEKKEIILKLIHLKFLLL